VHHRATVTLAFLTNRGGHTPMVGGADCRSSYRVRFPSAWSPDSGGGASTDAEPSLIDHGRDPDIAVLSSSLIPQAHLPAPGERPGPARRRAKPSAGDYFPARVPRAPRGRFASNNRPPQVLRCRSGPSGSRGAAAPVLGPPMPRGWSLRRF
jgi:hypothetical protein